MEMTNRISRQLLLWIVVWFLILGLVLALSEYWEMRILKSSIYEYLQPALKQHSFEPIEQALKNVTLIFWQVLTGSLVVVGFLLWLTLRSSHMRVLGKDEAAVPPRAKPQKKKETAADDQRRALHLLSLLQREGRLVDFLREDLEAYDDAQIGVAVRSIHENCRKALDKYLAPEAVIDRDEGEEVTFDQGFDARAVKFTGNVTDTLPLKGILQHRGWRSTAFDLPTLSGGVQDPSIIAPAEVEIE